MASDQPLRRKAGSEATPKNDLLSWLSAQLDNDERWARAGSVPYLYADPGSVPPPDGVHWRWVTGVDWEPAVVDPVVSECVADGDPVWLVTVETWPVSYSGTDVVRPTPVSHGEQIQEMSAVWAGHIALHDPARVLRQVAASRRVLARHRCIDQPDAHPPVAICICCYKVAPCPELLDLASVYSDRPGFDPSWEPA